MKKRIIIVLSILIVILISAFIYFKLFHNANTIIIKKKDNTVPVFEISLNNTTLDEITSNPKTIKYKDNNIKIIEEDKLLYEDIITIKGRGHTTWDFPKKPYQITFSEEIDLFGLGSSKKWILLSNFVDETNLRNHLTFLLGRSLNMPYTNDGIFIDLYIDGEYQGIYYLTQKIEIGKDRIDLKNDDGIVMEIDNFHYKEEEVRFNSDIEQTYITLKDIKNEEYQEEAFNNFKEKYNQLEQAIFDYDWESILELCDIESFAKYYLISEFTKNGDAYKTSFYLYMDGKNDKIHAGPIWDFDIAYKNNIRPLITNSLKYFKYNHFVDTTSSIKSTKEEKTVHIFDKLLEKEEFNQLLSKIYKEEMKDTKDSLLTEIDKQYEIIKNSVYKNIDLWKYQDTYQESLNVLKEYINKRYEELDELYKD